MARYNLGIVPEYKPQTIEKKWQEQWRSSRAFEVTEDSPKPKFYCLEMFAYPSGHAHVGVLTHRCSSQIAVLPPSTGTAAPVR